MYHQASCSAAHGTHSLSLPMRPLSCVISDLIFSLRASQEGTKLVPMDPAAISMSAESPPSAAPRSFAVALQVRHRDRQQQQRHVEPGAPDLFGSAAALHACTHEVLVCIGALSGSWCMLTVCCCAEGCDVQQLLWTEPSDTTQLGTRAWHV